MASGQTLVHSVKASCLPAAFDIFVDVLEYLGHTVVDKSKKSIDVEISNYEAPVSKKPAIDGLMALYMSIIEAEARFLEGDLFCEATFTTVKNWLDQCPEAHPKCRSREKLNPNPGTVPTRLLDTHGSQAKTWSLIETSHTIPASSDYVALSHRWSKDTPKLENANRSQYQTPQLDGLLPRTYQDVFTLCRALDIRYVWIDSLCIIQDSVEDFEREVATMMSVYMNALCTFSVCWEYPNAGLSFYRKPKTFLCWPETYMATTGPKTHAFVRDIMDWEEAVDSAPVNTRGWVFQERLLSPRILYLGNDVLFWECDDFLTSEMAPGRSVFSRINIAAELGDLARQWPYLVSAFMRKDLSYEKDRLFAISGIAQLFAQRTSETFLAGLRKTCWAHDLLWHPRPFSSSENRSPSAAMPSWSWATCPAPLDWPTSFEMDCASSYSDFKPEVNILGHLSARSLEAFGCNIYGKPGSASLDISGLLIPARYEEFNDETGASNARIEWLQYPHNPQYTRVKSDGFFFSTSHPKKDRRGPSLISLSIGERTSEHTDFSLSCFVLPLLEKSESNLFDDPEVTDHPMGDYRFFDLHALIIQERPRNSADIEETERIEFKEAYRGIINGIWEQLLKHDSDASEADGANEDMEFDTGLWQQIGQLSVLSDQALIPPDLYGTSIDQLLWQL
ncbi:hypothetical protein BHE90_011774 [Fusarium euwallaceae]|uniref:Heterokaryon incompatibility domain-containing protein n=1 Tax=Fusarium euwallaceae TaxID=1147111 RepID=A0A430LDK8_9HYPO|nr:hypothetical protein BHE90_011774 [Fusarium euwallaceae]